MKLRNGSGNPFVSGGVGRMSHRRRDRRGALRVAGNLYFRDVASGMNHAVRVAGNHLNIQRRKYDPVGCNHR